jgi:hypothetical protein
MYSSSDTKEWFTRCSEDIPPIVEAIEINMDDKTIDLSKYPSTFNKEDTRCGKVRRNDQTPKGGTIYSGIKKFAYDISIFGPTLAITSQVIEIFYCLSYAFSFSL